MIILAQLAKTIVAVKQRSLAGNVGIVSRVFLLCPIENILFGAEIKILYVHEQKNERKGRIIMKNGLIVNVYGDKRWYKYNLLHRTDGPAVMCSNGDKYWFIEGKLHRIDGPAVIHYDNSYKAWYFEDQLHRTDGPAIIDYDSEYWWLDNKCLTHEEWLIAVAKL
jgi:hypothetical protein